MTYILFPDPPVEGAWTVERSGYEYWLRPWVSHFVQLALLHAFKAMGQVPAPVPPLVADCATADGDTPSGHPGDSHDSGLNLDVTYAMTAWPGSHHVGPMRDNRLSGPPTHLFGGYQAAFFAYVGILDRQNGGCLTNAAVDPRIEPILEANIEGFVEVSPESRRRAKDLINASRDASWLAWHADHTHLRFRDRGADEEGLAETLAAQVEDLLREMRGEAPQPAPAPAAGPAPEPVDLTLEERVAELERWRATVEGG
jgi:hypothetical protein